MKYLLLLLALATKPLFAQTDTQIPDCRTVTTPGSVCAWSNGYPPGKQKVLGQIDLANPTAGTTLATVTEPLLVHLKVAPAVKQAFFFSLGGLYSLQSENFDFDPPKRNGRNYVPNNHVSDGFTLIAKHQWSDLRGLEVRGEIIRYDTFAEGLSLNPGDNHTYSATLGPNVQHKFGIVVPYFTPQVGYLYQYRSGLKVGAAAGIDVKAGKHLTIRAGDIEYAYGVQFTKPHTNPLHGRDKLSTGVYWKF